MSFKNRATIATAKGFVEDESEFKKFIKAFMELLTEKEKEALSRYDTMRMTDMTKESNSNKNKKSSSKK